MKVLSRILLVLVVLCMAAGLVALLSLTTFAARFPWLTALVHPFFARYPWLPMALAVEVLVLLALCVLAIVLAVSRPTGRGHFTIHRKMGKIEISKQSIESAACELLSTVEGLKRYAVQVTGTPKENRVKLAVSFEPQNGADMTKLAAAAQDAVQNGLAHSLGVDVQSVHVLIRECPAKEAPAPQYAQVPRVI